jgi:hypothetical protein
MQFHQHRFFFKATWVCTPRARPRQQLLVCSRGHCSSVDGVHATRHVQQNADGVAADVTAVLAALFVCLFARSGFVTWTKKKKLLTVIPSLVASDFQPHEQQHRMLPQRGLAPRVINDSFPQIKEQSLARQRRKEGCLRIINCQLRTSWQHVEAPHVKPHMLRPTNIECLLAFENPLLLTKL